MESLCVQQQQDDKMAPTFVFGLYVWKMIGTSSIGIEL